MSRQTLHHSESDLTGHWQDSRAEAKAAAAAKLTLVKRRALWHAAHRSCRAAIETGSPRYVGSICKRNRAHGGERYVSGGGCVECARIERDRHRRLHGAPVIGPRPKARHSLHSSKRQAARRRRAEERCGVRSGPTVRPLLGLPNQFLQKVAQPELSICSKKK